MSEEWCDLDHYLIKGRHLLALCAPSGFPTPPAGEEVVLHRHGTLPDTDDDENYWCGWPSCAGIHEGEHATAIIVRGGKEKK